MLSITPTYAICKASDLDTAEEKVDTSSTTDVYFLRDASPSMASFYKMNNFVSKLRDTLSGISSIGIVKTISFSTTAMVSDSIEACPSTYGQSTDILGGLSTVLDTMVSEESGTNLLFIFLTDGLHNASSDFEDRIYPRVQSLSQYARGAYKNIKATVIGVGDKFPLFISMVIREQLSTDTFMSPLFVPQTLSEFFVEVRRSFEHDIEVSTTTSNGQTLVPLPHAWTHEQEDDWENIILTHWCHPDTYLLFSRSANDELDPAPFPITLAFCLMVEKIVNRLNITDHSSSQVFAEKFMLLLVKIEEAFRTTQTSDVEIEGKKTFSNLFQRKVQHRQKRSAELILHQILERVSYISTGNNLKDVAQNDLAIRLRSVSAGAYHDKARLLYGKRDKFQYFIGHHLCELCLSLRDAINFSGCDIHTGDTCGSTQITNLESASDLVQNPCGMDYTHVKTYRELYESFPVVGRMVTLEFVEQSPIQPFSVVVSDVPFTSQNFISSCALLDTYHPWERRRNSLIPLGTDHARFNEAFFQSEIVNLITTYYGFGFEGIELPKAHLALLSALLQWTFETDSWNSEEVQHLRSRVLKTLSSCIPAPDLTALTSPATYSESPSLSLAMIRMLHNTPTVEGVHLYVREHISRIIEKKFPESKIRDFVTDSSEMLEKKAELEHALLEELTDSITEMGSNEKQVKSQLNRRLRAVPNPENIPVTCSFDFTPLVEKVKTTCVDTYTGRITLEKGVSRAFPRFNVSGKFIVYCCIFGLSHRKSFARGQIPLPLDLGQPNIIPLLASDHPDTRSVMWNFRRTVISEIVEAKMAEYRRRIVEDHQVCKTMSLQKLQNHGDASLLLAYNPETGLSWNTCMCPQCPWYLKPLGNNQSHLATVSRYTLM